MTPLLGLEVEEIKAWLVKEGKPAFTAKQIVDWIYQKGVDSFDKMSNLSLDLRKKLAEQFVVSPVTLSRVQESQDQETIKFLWKLADGKLVESVLIMSDDRRTVCVSSQVGCPARCAFCASGQKGFFRNLTAGEIIAQVYETQNYLAKKNERVSHVVYMGMGEPFRNYEDVVKSIRILVHPDQFGISQRRITVSTVGVVEGIERFSDENIKVNLVLSLHAPNQRVRQKIIPYARNYSLDDILRAMDIYADKTKRDITFEYTLISGINDQEEHARELVQLLKGKQCTVNLIPYNPVPNVRLQKPTAQAVRNFREILSHGRIVNTCRYTKGDDIAAACGQLFLQESLGQPISDQLSIVKEAVNV